MLNSAEPHSTVQPIVLFGATATGKSAAIAHLVDDLRQHRFELISADSRQVYRGFDIGTAKPQGAERQRLTHHLIDVADGHEHFDVGRFVLSCDELVADITRRGGVPLISGGTAFYLQRYLFGLPSTPAALPGVRAELEERLRREGLAALRRELHDVDPVSEGRIGANDAYRVLRALEVYRSTGTPLSSYDIPDSVRSHIRPLIVGLYRDRGELYRRINERVRTMVEQGLVGEVEGLLARGHNPDEPAFRSIGYREFVDHGGSPPWSPEQLRRIEEDIAKNTRRYAKRQELFFRRLPDVVWIHADEIDRIVEVVRRWLAGTPIGTAERNP